MAGAVRSGDMGPDATIRPRPALLAVGPDDPTLNDTDVEPREPRAPAPVRTAQIAQTARVPAMKLPPADSELGKLMAMLPRQGRVEWIGLRPKREVAMDAVTQVIAQTGAGLV